MTALPLVSVVMPTYNCAHFVNEAVSSVLAQDYSGLELIVVDDGSTDGTPERLPQHETRMQILRQRNAGPAAARNRGAAAARGEFIAFLDCDDVWLPGKLTVQVRHLLRHPEVGLVHGLFRDWYPDKTGAYPLFSDFTPPNNPVTLVASDSGWVYPELLLDFMLCTSTVVLRRDLFEHIGGFDESYRIGEDYDLWLRLARVTPFHKLDMSCILYRKHGSNVTSRPPEQNYAYRALMSTITRFGLRGPDGREADPKRVELHLAKLCLIHAYTHFWRGDPCLAVEAINSARRHGHRPLKWLGYSILARARCALAAATRSLPAGKRNT